MTTEQRLSVDSGATAAFKRVLESARVDEPAATRGPTTNAPMNEVRVVSRTRRGTWYRVTFGIDGAAVCTCAGWEFRATCPHIEIARRSR